MAFADNLQYQIENISIYFQGGIRRSILIFAGVSLVLLTPTYFIAQQANNIWSSLSINSQRLQTGSIVTPKNINLQQFELSQTQVVQLMNGENSLYVTADNKINPEVGFYPYVYSVQTLNSSGTILSQQTKRSYILPGEVKYIVAQSPENSATTLKIQQLPETKSILYNQQNPNVLKKPNVSIRGKSIDIDEAKQNIKIKIDIKNEEDFKIRQIDFLIIIRGSRQDVVGVREYSLDTTSPGERSFTVDYPLPKNGIAPSIIDVRWSVNYLDKTTYIK
jgi:hypothetical protein